MHSSSGLRYVAEAEPNAMEARAFPPPVAGVLNGLAARDPLLKEQYLDFLRLRRFRQTLLSIDGPTPSTEPDVAAVPALAVSGKPKAESVDLAAGVAVTFTAERGASARTDLPIAKAALAELASRWPKRIPFPDLVDSAAARLGRERDRRGQQPAGPVHRHGLDGRTRRSCTGTCRATRIPSRSDPSPAHSRGCRCGRDRSHQLCCTPRCGSMTHPAAR